MLTSYVLESTAGGTRLTCRCALLHDAMPAPLRWLILAFFTTALRGAVATALEQAKFAIEHPGEAAPVRAGLHVEVNAAVHGAPAPPPAAPGPEERYSTAFLVSANLLPLVGVLWLGWDVASIVLLYWAENLIVGFYNALRMATASGPLVAKLALIPFFIFHYGMFCTVHGALLVGLFHLEPRVHVSGLSAPALFAAVARMPGMAWPLLALFASHGVSFVEHHFVRGERAMGAASFMGRPYGRMIVLHVAIILGGFGVAALGASNALLVVLVGLKLALDVFAHRRSHGPVAGPSPARAIPT